MTAAPSRRAVLASGLAAAAAGAAACSTVPGASTLRSAASMPHSRPRPLVIAHRGASGERPEHTLAAYRLGIEQGADFIEPDLVPTRDGHLVARHENEIGGTTDVASHPRFADRRLTKRVDGEEVTGWFTEDFTLEELKTLRCRERLPQLRPGNTAFDGQETIPTLDEVIQLARSESARLGRTIGIYPETKHPSYFEALGLSFDVPLLAALERAGWTGADAPVLIQSFEVANLQRLARQTRVRLVQLVSDSGAPFDAVVAGRAVSYADMVTPQGLAAIARYAAGLGPAKALIVPRTAAGASLAPTGLVSAAHAAGLVVHPWTFRAENFFLPLELRRGDPASATFLREPGDLAAEVRQFVELGVDGLFADFPGIAASVVAQS
jgi:glycerophosphoryl diester phosphodiesterase